MKEIILDLNKPLVGLDDKPAEKTLAKLLSEMLVVSPDENAVKLFLVAQALHQSGKIVLDHEDFNLIRNRVQTTKVIAAIAQAQILIEMDNQKAEQMKPKVVDATGSA